MTGVGAFCTLGDYMKLEHLHSHDNSWFYLDDGRPSWHNTWLHIAFEMSRRATCKRGQVGCVIVLDNKIVSTGYNGAPHGERHCLEIGCDVQDDHCVRVIHAEQNALLLTPNKDHLKGAVVYVTVEPCQRCRNMLRQMGIGCVYYAEGLAEWKARQTG